MTRIKICGITRLEDALDAVLSGASALGLVFYDKSPRHISLQQAAQIVDAIPPFITLVGLFVNATAAEVHKVMEAVPLDALQFHGDEDPAFCAQFGRPYLKAIRVKAGVDLVQYAADFTGAQGLLLDAFVEGVPGGTGASFDWDLIPLDLPLPVILSGGLNPANVAAAMRKVRPYAVDVSSGVEESKGIKDAAKIAAFASEVIKTDLQLTQRQGSALRGHRTTVRQ